MVMAQDKDSVLADSLRQEVTSGQVTSATIGENCFRILEKFRKSPSLP